MPLLDSITINKFEAICLQIAYNLESYALQLLGFF